MSIWKRIVEFFVTQEPQHVRDAELLAPLELYRIENPNTAALRVWPLGHFDTVAIARLIAVESGPGEYHLVDATGREVVWGQAAPMPKVAAVA